MTDTSTETHTAHHYQQERDRHPEGSPEWLAYQGALEAVDPMERARRRVELNQPLPSTAQDAAQAIGEANQQRGRTIATTTAHGDTVIIAETRHIDATNPNGWQAPTMAELEDRMIAAHDDPPENGHPGDGPAEGDAHVPAGYVMDPVTGEVHRIDVLAADIAHLEREAQGHRDRLAQLEDMLTPKRYLFRLTGVDAHDAPGGARVTVVPGRPGQQRVNRKAAQAHADALIRAGVGRMEWTATADELRKMAAPVIAAGIPYQRILPDPSPGQPTVVVVWPEDEQEAAA